MNEPLNDSRYFEPSDYKEVDASPASHESEGHENETKYWAAQGCEDCTYELEQLDEIRFAVEIEFTLGDLSAAKRWAAKHNFKYDDKRHLLWDWMTAGTREFKPVIPIGRDS